MTSSVRILTTYSLDSSPAVLLISPSGDKTLINCGEGCQRSFLESPGLRVRSVTRICLTHIGHDSLGGLPGMVLTTADVTQAAMATDAAMDASDPEGTKRKDNPNGEELPPDLDIVGPRGTQAFLHSLRHFMRRDKFEMRVKEGTYCQDPREGLTSKRSKVGKRGRKKQKLDTSSEGFYVQTIPLSHHVEIGPTRVHVEKEVLSFVFTTPPLPGKFLPEKARELGIPPGPLYGDLKAGQSVVFVDRDGVERTVESSQVVAKGSPGVAIALIYCPSIHVLDQLKASEVLSELQRADEKANVPVLDLMVHMAPHNVFASDEYRKWRSSFPGGTDHIWLESYESLVDVGDRMSVISKQPTPFRAAALGALTRSLLNTDIFPSPLSYEVGGISSTKTATSRTGSFAGVVLGTSATEYIIIPRSKKGFQPVSLENGTTQAEWEELKKSVEETGAKELARSLCIQMPAPILSSGELIFTGTGSALPCKHRNVTGMHLEMSNGNSLLLDIGEGTIGQLLRAKHGRKEFSEILRNIKAVWISHPHADHHVGLLRLLAERKRLCDRGVDPILLMAPPNLFRFLSEYCHVDPGTTGSYIALDCRNLQPGHSDSMIDKLRLDLGITECVAIPVAHCPHSYAVFMDGTCFGRLAYSGDCRPSIPFAEAASGADLLIHEATFEDGMEGEATLKRHCTVGEALSIGRRMRAKAIVLTHFSQRYPRIPPLNRTESEMRISNQHEVQEGTTTDSSVAFAFDFMRITPASVVLASRLTPTLRLLYPAEDEANASEDEDTADSQVNGSGVLSVPGLFARKELL